MKVIRWYVVALSVLIWLRVKQADIDKTKMFRIGNKKLSVSVLLHAIGKLNSNNYIALWYSILKGVEKIDSREVKKSDIDKIANSGYKMVPSDFLMKSLLAFYSFNYLYGIFRLYLKRSLIVDLPTGKFRIEKRSILKNIKLSSSAIDKFLDILKRGHGIVYKKFFPYYLLFCFYFLEDFAKSIAYKNKKNKAELVDIVNSYSKLNSITMF